MLFLNSTFFVLGVLSVNLTLHELWEEPNCPFLNLESYRLERRRSRVVTVARLWRRKSP